MSALRQTHNSLNDEKSVRPELAMIMTLLTDTKILNITYNNSTSEEIHCFPHAVECSRVQAMNQ